MEKPHLRVVCKANGLPERIVGKCIVRPYVEELIIKASIENNGLVNSEETFSLVITPATDTKHEVATLKIILPIDLETLKFKKDPGFTIE